MSRGYVDSASIHSALAVLKLGKTELVSRWERQCLLESTYLFVFTDIGVIAGPGRYRGASGLFSEVVNGFPTLERKRFRGRDLALSSTKAWLEVDLRDVRTAWRKIQAHREFEAWSRVWIELFWLDHVRMHGSLFNNEFLPELAKILRISEKELDRVRQMSNDEQTLRDWLKRAVRSDEAKVASDAYLLSSLVRGRYHEYLAESNKVHLCDHPSRAFVRRALSTTPGEPVLMWEEFFVKAIVGSALIETNPARRMNVWIENVTKARRAVESRSVALQDPLTQESSETLAAEAAKKYGISTTYSRIRKEMEYAIGFGLGGLISVAISPWLSPAAVSVLVPVVAKAVPIAYSHYARRSLGDDLTKRAFDTNRRFRRLMRSQPGRIERQLRLPPS